MSDVQFVTAPSVYVTARLLPQYAEIGRFCDDHGFSGEALDLMGEAPDSEIPITIGSRTCYQSFDAGRPHGEHVQHLVEVQHGSCLEHCVWQVLLTGISRACGRELLRHRHLSPSELSQRYCDMSKARLVVPPLLLDDYKQWQREQDDVGVSERPVYWAAKERFQEFWSAAVGACNSYVNLVGDLACGKRATKSEREAARAVLPECVETRIVFTGNARAFRNLFERRCSKHADAEIRRVCCVLFDRLAVDAPYVFADYEKSPLPDGSFELTTPSRAV